MRRPGAIKIKKSTGTEAVIPVTERGSRALDRQSKPLEPITTRGERSKWQAESSGRMIGHRVVGREKPRIDGHLRRSRCARSRNGSIGEARCIGKAHLGSPAPASARTPAPGTGRESFAIAAAAPVSGSTTPQNPRGSAKIFPPSNLRAG